MCDCVDVCMHVHMAVCVSVSTRVRAHLWVCMHVNMAVRLCVSTCV